ncbi:sigma-54-dependent Fis family transcriptional regulator [bacterium]|nr:sigma-54-dependent Fis family transcriptional regulator [bacterium]
MNKASVLIVDDELKIRRILQIMLENENYKTEQAKDGAEALKKMEYADFDLIITDMKMPNMNGIELLEQIQKRDNTVPVIMMTAYGTIQTAVEAMKKGAYDYILKPFDLEEMKITVDKAYRLTFLERENKYLKEELEHKHSDKIIGKTSRMKKVYKLIKQVSKTKGAVLIYGESGTGKELIARTIHNCSPRKDGPFIVANCISLSENLLEIELFGHEKQASNLYKYGSRQAPSEIEERKIGRLELANNGTLFLNEVSVLSEQVQERLLSLLEKETDIRIIAATNRNLPAAIKESRFSKAFYNKLSDSYIALPPLLERKGDIPFLIQYFIQKFSQSTGKRIDGISHTAMNALLNYTWPGNVGELRNIVERAVVLETSSIIGQKNLPFYIATYEEKISPSENKTTYIEIKKEVVDDFGKE